MSLLALIGKNRGRLNADLGRTDKFWYVTATSYSLYQSLLPILRQHARGRLLDAGAGYLQYRHVLQPMVTSYESLDYDNGSAELDHVGDVQNLISIPAESYDTVFCNQVLEHVPSPWRAVPEMHRILRNGGKVIISVPHLSRLHDEPFDFYRYTGYALTHLLKESGFKDIAVVPSGGLFCFLFNQFSTVLLGVVWSVPVLCEIVFFVNKWLAVIPIVWLENRSDRRTKFPLNYIAVGTK